MVNIKFISSRTRGGSLAAEQYVMVGPNFTGSLPSHFDEDHIIRSLSRFTLLIGRTRVFDLLDLPYAIAVQNGYTLASLDGNEVPKTKVPVFPFLDKEELAKPTPEPQVFFSYANFIANYMKIEDYDTNRDLFKKFAKIEVGPLKEFIGQNMSQKMYSKIKDGVADGSKKIDDTVAAASNVVVRGWSDLYKPIVAHGTDYLARAVYAKIVKFANVPKEETVHFTGWQDTDGDLLDSTEHDYTMTFSPGSFPDVVKAYGGFWSVTIYVGSGTDQGTLVHSPTDWSTALQIDMR